MTKSICVKVDCARELESDGLFHDRSDVDGAADRFVALGVLAVVEGFGRRGVLNGFEEGSGGCSIES